MNKSRLLKLLEILIKYTDMSHKLSINQLIAKLEESDIKVSNRKTLYDDFKILNEFGIQVEYDNGYYLIESPFSISEIKIIIDSLNSLKNLDNKLLDKLNNKLYSFISIYEEKQLRKIEYHNKHSDKKFLNRLEDTLQAIINQESLIIIKTNNKEETIIPIFLYRQNDYYYLYYHYLNSDKIYHTRFDNILDTKISDKKDNISISKSKIIEHISESTDAYYSKKSETIKFEIINDSQYLRDRLTDSFSNIVFTKNGFSLKASVNDVFFSKLTSFSSDIKISDKSIADKYIEFLNNIITHNL